jgi:hypothetical protein
VRGGQSLKLELDDLHPSKNHHNYKSDYFPRH